MRWRNFILVASSIGLWRLDQLDRNSELLELRANLARVADNDPGETFWIERPASSLIERRRSLRAIPRWQAFVIIIRSFQHVHRHHGRQHRAGGFELARQALDAVGDGPVALLLSHALGGQELDDVLIERGQGVSRSVGLDAGTYD